MELLLLLLLLLVLGAAWWAWIQKSKAERDSRTKEMEARRLQVAIAALEVECDELRARIRALAKYEGIPDVEESTRQSLARAREVLASAQRSAAAAQETAEREREALLAKLRQEATEAKQAAAREHQAALARVQQELADAHGQAQRLIDGAHKQAKVIAGEAYEAMARAQEYSATAEAIKGVIKGYGSEYIVPTYSLLDDLAADFGHAEAGARLKRARELSRAMVQANRAATCDYAEVGRRETAVRFVIDAFNGKVDSILSRVKSENHGKLEQEIRGAYAIVNHNGMAFRNARVLEEYLAARLDELHWAAATQALRDREREEQRRLREQMREEERARREYERAMKEAAQQEAAIKKALERVQGQAARASEAQRAAFEEQLRDLQQKLTQAEERGRRALSMAQQTKVGHVYIISNVGSFGECVFKIGMTRRLEPTDRVRELGDASVPFEFDIHAMIYSEDAPALERALHLQFLRTQVNKVNHRKEFFRLGLEDIRSHIDGLGIETHWTMTAQAHDYRETLRIEQQIQESPELAREWTEHQVAAEMEIQPFEDPVDA